ncbi:macrolide family glycosyltransferase [Streptomyces sp. NBC_01431]|uniref:macrolide family glycosyltransferase n=1 Tax=Streptomyces sp. NBC_01431 TaxID=2903863 RepID=UPI002E31F6A0|nr:macrolide family glycosyltransferase [Streptomyces sp. NBC_01431]
MSHIAFFNIPGTGHVNPTAGIVAELVARGHRVSYAVTTSQGAEVEKAGATLVPYESVMGAFRSTMTDLENNDRFTTGDFVQVLRGLVQETAALYPQLRRAFADDRPDVLIYDGLSGWTGRLLAENWGIPAVRSIPTLAANEHWSLGSDGEYAEFEPGHPGLNAVYGEIGAMLADIGVGYSAQEFFGSSESGPALVYIPRAFQFKGETFGEDVHFVGPCWSERQFDGEWVRGSDATGERPLVLVSLGTIHNDNAAFFQTCIDAFAELPWDIVMAVGNQITPTTLTNVPDHIDIRPHVPQLQILRQADLFITHAGMGSVMEALSFGVPMVAIPQMSEQRANADRLTQLGLGQLLHRDQTTPQTLRDTARHVLTDPTYRTNTHTMRHHITNAGGATTAADVVEALLTDARGQR